MSLHLVHSSPSGEAIGELDLMMCDPISQIGKVDVEFEAVAA